MKNLISTATCVPCIQIELDSLDSDDTFWSALSWNIAGQSSRRKRSPNNGVRGGGSTPGGNPTQGGTQGGPGGNPSPGGNPGEGQGQNDDSTCENEACDGLDGLLWERHQTRGDTVDFTFESGTFTNLEMNEGEAGLYVPDDNTDGIGHIEPHAIQNKNDKHYVLCMHAC